MLVGPSVAVGEGVAVWVGSGVAVGGCVGVLVKKTVGKSVIVGIGVWVSRYVLLGARVIRAKTSPPGRVDNAATSCEACFKIDVADGVAVTVIDLELF